MLFQQFCLHTRQRPILQQLCSAHWTSFRCFSSSYLLHQLYKSKNSISDKWKNHMKMFLKYDHLQTWHEIPSTTVYGEFGSTTAILIGPKFPNVSLNKGCGSFDWVLYLCLISWAWGQLLNQVKALAGYSVWTPSTEMKYCHFSPGNSFLLSFHTVRKKGKITYMYWDIYKTMLIYKIYSVLFSH